MDRAEPVSLLKIFIHLTSFFLNSNFRDDRDGEIQHCLSQNTSLYIYMYQKILTIQIKRLKQIVNFHHQSREFIIRVKIQEKLLEMSYIMLIIGCSTESIGKYI